MILSEIIAEKYSYEYKQYICDLNLGDLKKKLVWLDTGLNSTKLMTGLRHRYTGQKSNVSFDDYDVLYMVIAKRRTVWGELVVVNLPFPSYSFIRALYFLTNLLLGLLIFEVAACIKCP